MSIGNLLTKPVRIVYSSPGGKDQYGQPVSRETVVDSKCYYRMQNTLVGDAVYQAEEKIKVYLAADVKVEHISAIQIDSIRFEPAGVPFMQWNPRTKLNEYLVIPVRVAKS